MKWREVGGGEEREPKPSLAAVLTHYEAHFNLSRGSQMIHCVFHEDRTASMSVDLTQGVFNCHSCGEGGDSYALLMKKEGTDFNGARELATTFGLADGGAGGGDGELPSSGLTGRRRISRSPGTGSGNGGYKPTWRRD